MKPSFEAAMREPAVLSDDGVYRYTLRRSQDWPLLGTDAECRPCVFVMLNPSTADASRDDPTIRRCRRFALDWGYQPLLVVNLFALRSTDPRALAQHPSPVGPENDAWLHAVCAGAHAAGGLVVAAWGSHGALRQRDSQVVTSLHGIPLHVLSVTKSGTPGHPLYLSADSRPRLWA